MILPMEKSLRKDELLHSVLVSLTRKGLESILQTIGMVRNLIYSIARVATRFLTSHGGPLVTRRFSWK